MNLPRRKRYMIPEKTCLDTHESFGLMLTTASSWLGLIIPSFTSIWFLAPHAAYSGTIEYSNHMSLANNSQVATPDCDLRWRGSHQAFAFNLLAQSGLVMQYHGHKQLRGEYRNGGQWQRFADFLFFTSYTENWIPTLVHMEVPNLQLTHFLTALFSHSEPRLPPWDCPEDGVWRCRQKWSWCIHSLNRFLHWQQDGDEEACKE